MLSNDLEVELAQALPAVLMVQYQLILIAMRNNPLLDKTRKLMALIGENYESENLCYFFISFLNSNVRRSGAS